MDNLCGVSPQSIMLHGPTKLLLDAFHWHQPDFGIVASYTAKARDVHDHFGLFRGVDQIEAFAQATIVSCGTFNESRKQNFSAEELRAKFIPAFISIGNVSFHHYIEEGDTFISIGIIKFYKWRQMVCDGRIYKVRKDLDLDAYFKDFSKDKIAAYELSEDFTLVAELFEVTGRALKKDTFRKDLLKSV
jgi:hypothetical protein